MFCWHCPGPGVTSPHVSLLPQSLSFFHRQLNSPSCEIQTRLAAKTSKPISVQTLFTFNMRMDWTPGSMGESVCKMNSKTQWIHCACEWQLENFIWRVTQFSLRFSGYNSRLKRFTHWLLFQLTAITCHETWDVLCRSKEWHTSWWSYKPIGHKVTILFLLKNDPFEKKCDK